MNVSGARACSVRELVSDAWDVVFFTMLAMRTIKRMRNTRAAWRRGCP